jgi:hypothetical protein
LSALFGFASWGDTLGEASSKTVEGVFGESGFGGEVAVVKVTGAGCLYHVVRRGGLRPAETHPCPPPLRKRLEAQCGEIRAGAWKG